MEQLRAWAKTIAGPRVTDALAPDLEELPRQWCDISERDSKAQGRLTKRKRDAVRVAEILQGIGDPRISRMAEAMRECGERVRLIIDADSGEVLSRAICCRCHGRWCPVCVWQRALRWRRLVMDAVEELSAAWDTRWILLTLTTRNCAPHEVRERVDQMNRAFSRMVKRKRWPGVGYVRALEVTRGRKGTAHVHYHALIAVPPEYFKGRDYIQQREYVAMWRKALRVEYNPLVYVQAIKADRLAPSAVGEALKYPIKLTAAALEDPAWLRDVVLQLGSARAVAAGGICRLGLFAARRRLEERQMLRAKELEGRRVIVRWFRWTGHDYLPAPADLASSWTTQLRATWEGVELKRAA